MAVAYRQMLAAVLGWLRKAVRGLAMAITYWQKTGDHSATRAGFSQEGGSVTDELFVKGGDEIAAITDLIGSVKPAGNGSLARSLPKCHPQYDWTYAAAVENIQGLGNSPWKDGEAGKLVDANAALEAPPYISQYWRYPAYCLTVKFTQRNYAVLPDSIVNVTQQTGYKEDGSSYTFNYPDNEWLRFTSYEIAPSAELITAQQGQTVFALSASAVSPPGATSPHGRTFQGYPRIYLNKSGIKLTWYNIPFSYVESANSFIVAAIGSINQSPWYKWPIGSLLYLGCVVTPHVPPVPDIETWTGYASYSASGRRCDVTFAFDRVERSQSAFPDNGPSGINNYNVVPGGHNLQPYLGDRQFYFAAYPGPPLAMATGTAQAGGASTITLAAGTPSSITPPIPPAPAGSPAQPVVGMTITLTGGTGADQARKIKSLSGVVATVDAPWATGQVPDATTTYSLVSSARANLNDYTRWRGTFPSYPFARIFSDPDAPGA